MDKQFYQDMLDILVEDQSKQGLRLHKGYPLYWLAESIGSTDVAKALQHMLEAFVEDVLTHGHDAFPGFAATSLRNDFGLTTESLIALKELVIEKARTTFYPSYLVKDFVSQKGEQSAKDNFKGVTDESRYESIVAQAKERIVANLRPSITTPVNESVIQDVVFVILMNIDPHTVREKTLDRVAEKESKIDFAMGDGKIGVEVKLIREGRQKGSVVNEINADISSYGPFMKKVLFVVYDACGAIHDMTGFAADIRKGRPEIEVLVIKH